MSSQPRVWFIDTSTLLSMAADQAIENVVLTAIGLDHVRIVDVVERELVYRATRPETKRLAQTAIAQMPSTWRTMDTYFLDEGEIAEAQDDVADGRLLKDDYEHWAEATIITLARKAVSRGNVLDIQFMTEDFEARRVACTVPGVQAQSIHRLLYERVQARLMPAHDAQTISGLLYDSGRSRTSTTVEDFTRPNRKGLGRAGQP